MSTSKNKDKLIPRKKYSIKEKMEYVAKYYTIKKQMIKMDLNLFLKNQKFQKTV